MTRHDAQQLFAGCFSTRMNLLHGDLVRLYRRVPVLRHFGRSGVCLALCRCKRKKLLGHVELLRQVVLRPRRHCVWPLSVCVVVMAFRFHKVARNRWGLERLAKLGSTLGLSRRNCTTAAHQQQQQQHCMLPTASRVDNFVVALPPCRISPRPGLWRPCRSCRRCFAGPICGAREFVNSSQTALSNKSFPSDRFMLDRA